MQRSHDLRRTPRLIDAEVAGQVRAGSRAAGRCHDQAGANEAGIEALTASCHGPCRAPPTAVAAVFDVDRHRPAVTELPGVGDEVRTVDARARAPDRRRVTVVSAVEEVVVRHGVTDGEAGELDERAQDARSAVPLLVPPPTRQPGLLSDDRRVGAEHTVVGLRTPVGGQVDTGAIAVVVASRPRLARVDDARGAVMSRRPTPLPKP